MWNKPTWGMGLADNGHGERLDTSSRDPGGIPKAPRRPVRPYTPRQTEPRNGVTPHWLSARKSGSGVNSRKLVTADEGHYPYTKYRETLSTGGDPDLACVGG